MKRRATYSFTLAGGTVLKLSGETGKRAALAIGKFVAKFGEMV